MSEPGSSLASTQSRERPGSAGPHFASEQAPCQQSASATDGNFSLILQLLRATQWPANMLRRKSVSSVDPLQSGYFNFGPKASSPPLLSGEHWRRFRSCRVLSSAREGEHPIVSPVVTWSPCRLRTVGARPGLLEPTFRSTMVTRRDASSRKSSGSWVMSRYRHVGGLSGSQAAKGKADWFLPGRPVRLW